jgi:serine/threonine protein kinase
VFIRFQDIYLLPKASAAVMLANRNDLKLNKLGAKMSPTSTNQPVASQLYCAAEMLEGVVLNNGWKVIKKVPKPSTATGGCFSVPYFVEKLEGKKRHLAFLKALNFRQLLAQPDIAKAMEQHTRAFNFEKETLELCKGRKLRRIAHLIESGQYSPQNCPWPVAYIIFELADGGDARNQLAKLGHFDLAWMLRTLHEISVGLQQLHGEGIAHQDLKPSNVLFFESFGARIADLGCADTEHKPSESPRGHLGIPGDPNYAPPELFYNEVSSDWKIRRLGCDHYLLGSLVVFFFNGGVSFNAILRQKIHPSHSPLQWTHDYRTVLPYIKQAFEEALLELEKDIPDSIRTSIIEIVRWLCEPDPKRRGHPTDLSEMHGSQFSLQRVISAFDFLATKAEYGLVKA